MLESRSNHPEKTLFAEMRSHRQSLDSLRSASSPAKRTQVGAELRGGGLTVNHFSEFSYNHTLSSKDVGVWVRGAVEEHTEQIDDRLSASLNYSSYTGTRS